MNKLGTELMVTVTSSENASRRFSKVVKDPFIAPLFEILHEPICLSIQAEDAFLFTIKTIAGENFTATAMRFDIPNHRRHYVVLGGDMVTTKEIPPIVFTALSMHAKIAEPSPIYTIEYDSLKNIAVYKSYGRTESVGISGLKNFSKLCSYIDSIGSGEMAGFLRYDYFKGDVLNG